MRILLCVVAVVGLSACTGMEITTPPVQVTPKNPRAASGDDVFAANRAAGQNVPIYKGSDLVPVRAYKSDDRGRNEVAGATCQIQSQPYSATLATPAYLQVPNYGRYSPPITAQCTLDDAEGGKTVQVFNETKEERRRSGQLALGLIGLAIAEGINAGSDTTNDDFAYPQIEVDLK